MMLHRFVEPAIRSTLTRMGVPADHPIPLETPRNAGQGDLASTVAMSLAKALGKAPKVIAEEICSDLREAPYIQHVEVAGPGFINVTFDRSVYHMLLAELLQQGDGMGRSTLGAGARVNVEYVSANPTGPLHAGHGRNCAVGDTIANLYAWCGFNVTREYYFNNAGNQMNKLAESIDARLHQHLGADVAFPEDGYHGEYIAHIAQQVAEVHGSSVLDLPEAERRDLCKKAGEQWCFAAIRATLDRLNIHHDVYFNEDSLYSDGKVQHVIDTLRSNGLAYEKDGALWFALEQMGNPQDKVIVKSSGEPTYRLPDIAYHCDKLERGFDVVVDIFGADHIATIPDVVAGVRAMGLDETKIRTVIHQMVTFIEGGEVVKFSKRSGTSFTLDDLIEEVGADVVRFFFIMRAVGTHLEFDLTLAKEEGDKNPVFYLQYAHARIASILRKAAEQGLDVSAQADLSVLVHDNEIALIDVLSRYSATIERACVNLEPQAVAEYLREVAASYHHFYHECRILGTDEPLQSARLALALVTQRALRNGLHIVGVSAPDVM